MAARSTTVRTDSVTPTFRGLYLERFLRLVEAIDGLASVAQRRGVQAELKWCKKDPGRSLEHLKYFAALMVLSDVLGQGWRTQYRQRRIFLTRPDYTHGKHFALDHSLVKNQIRDAFQEERLAKITSPSAARFIARMERPSNGKKSIFTLVRSGDEFAKALRGIPPDADIKDLRQVVDPYLQLAKADSRDHVSGQKLLDIWRYFRYLWAIPYRSTPGRNLFYLVRDAARPEHPVIGIAALGNCVVQLSERDQLIGWSVEAVEKSLQRRHRVITRDLPKTSLVRRISEVEYLESVSEYAARAKTYSQTLVASMSEALNLELAGINKKGLVTSSECSRPTSAVIARLQAIAADSDAARRRELRAAYLEGTTIRRRGGGSAVRDDTNSKLYIRKRAHALAEVLASQMVFQKENIAIEPEMALRRLLASDDGRRALRIGLLSNKKVKIGTSLMDIIVCGAIPPYGELLGGKLVAMLMASPQVVRDYSEAYGQKHTQIASGLAGRKIIRAADLVFLTTTSLYHVGSSQYERIRIPVPNGNVMTFEHIGKTEGFGSTALSSETVKLLRQLIVQSEGMLRVNSMFGEGVSPKLRLVRDGLALIGMPQELVLRHDCPRLIYGIRLARNAFEYLRGEMPEPEYYFSRTKVEEGTDSIVNHWLERWLKNRARRSESLERIRNVSSDSIALSRLTNSDLSIADNLAMESRNVGVG